MTCPWTWRRQATVGGVELALTTKEFEVLAVLARRAGAAVSRQLLLDEVWGDAYLAVSRSLDVHIFARNYRTPSRTRCCWTTRWRPWEQASPRR